MYPELCIHEMRLLTDHGQFSQVLIVNNTLIFRFPRTDSTARDMIHELAILDQLQGQLPLPIPHPLYRHSTADKLIFMGYAMLPGEPLWRETIDAIQDEMLLNRLARQLADFLKVLHSLPLHSRRPIGETRQSWIDMLTAFQSHLYPHMRPDAQREVTHRFHAFLNEERHFAYQPVLRHGDFGGSNILYDAQAGKITGIIDFGFAGYGDAAQDVGGLSTYGETFLARGMDVYPEMAGMTKRIDFYRSTYALQQALYALENGNEDDFQDGIADYV